MFPFTNLCLQLTKSYTVNHEIVDCCIQAARKEQEAEDGYIILGRGFATITLPGIDVLSVLGTSEQVSRRSEPVSRLLSILGL